MVAAGPDGRAAGGEGGPAVWTRLGLGSRLLLFLELEEMFHVPRAVDDANHFEAAGDVFVEDDVVFK